MAKKNTYKGLILPGDLPLRSASLKRQLLFFDSIAIASPHDKALVHHEEISEDFPGMSMKWGEYANFPRSEDYFESYETMLKDASLPIRKGLIHILPHREKNSDDAGANFMLYNSAISDKRLVLNAIPDFHDSRPTIAIPDGIITGGGLSQAGYTSKYELKVNNPYQIGKIAREWELLAYLRIGRALKYMRRANNNGYIPVATDEVNHSLCNVLTASQNIDDKIISDRSNNNYIPLEIVDPYELEHALNEMSWSEVLKVRKKILPKASNFRKSLFDSFNSLSKKEYAPSEISKYISELKRNFQTHQNELANEWEKFRIASVLRTGGVVGASAIGMSAIPSLSGTWEEIFIRVVGVGLISIATLTAELKTLIPAKRKVKKHPLFFSTMLPNSKS